VNWPRIGLIEAAAKLLGTDLKRSSHVLDLVIGNKMPLGIRESCGRAYKHLEGFQVRRVFKGGLHHSCLGVSLNDVSALHYLRSSDQEIDCGYRNIRTVR